MAVVRYYSRSGITKKIAEAIAEGVGTKAVSVDAPEAALTERTDVLFLGSALYAYGLDANMKAYLKTLSRDQVEKAVLFSTSWISKHALDLMRDALTAEGIPVETETFYCKSKAADGSIAAAKEFAKKFAG